MEVGKQWGFSPLRQRQVFEAKLHYVLVGLKVPS